MGSNETRVNLLHLLEDIRDSYTASLPEVIITELIANCLDSGASRIDFFLDHSRPLVRCTDNGCGMKRQQLKEYHNIAASSKIRGIGIGFAGIGAKLSLLVAESVITETRGPHGSQSATEWRLTGPYRAPWKFIPYSGSIPFKGTAVSILLKDRNSSLLSEQFISQTITKHFYPLLCPEVLKLLKPIYRHGVEFYVNNGLVTRLIEDDLSARYWFDVRLDKGRKPVGIGFIKTNNSTIANGISQPASRGLVVSTHGKIIKTGWEWIGISPKNRLSLSGTVEIPALAELLTTNKNEFLSDSASLKKYYKYRKAIQEAVIPILRMLGEEREETPVSDQNIKPLARQIEYTLGTMIGDFPELSSLVGLRRRMMPGFKNRDKLKKIGSKRTVVAVGEKEPKEIASGHEGVFSRGMVSSDSASDKKIKLNQPGLKIVLEEFGDAGSVATLGKMVEETISINTKHPAWLKAKGKNMDQYHIVCAVALVLSEFLDENKSPQDFIGRFLSGWGESADKIGRLF